MNTSLRDRNSMARSANLSSSTSRLKTTKPLRTSTNPLSRTTAEPGVFDNIEIEYIKNLQQQIHFLELECNYLRKQVDLNGLKTTNSSSFENSKRNNDVALSMQIEKTNLERSLLEENKRKESALNALQTSEKSFQIERELLLREVNSLKKIKQELEDALVNKNVEVNKLKDNLNRHHMENIRSSQDTTKTELQIDGLRKDNLALREEINEARSLLISRDSLIKSLQHELAETSNRKMISNDLKNSFSDLSVKLSMANDLLGKETNNSKLLLDQNMRYERELNDFKNRLTELNAENSRLSNALEMSLKQNEADLVMAKKNADLAKKNLEQLKNELDRERAYNSSLSEELEQFKRQERSESTSQTTLRKRVRDLEELVESREVSIRTLQEQLKQKQKEVETERAQHHSLGATNRTLDAKINELNDDLDKLHLNHKVQSESSKNKLSQLQAELDAATMQLNNEISNNKGLQLKIDGLTRQETVNINMITSLRQRVSELETQLQEHLLKEPEFLSQLQAANLNLGRLEEENSRLRSEIDLLGVRLKEIDRLKQLEDLIQSQRWHELGDLADSMKNLSVMMSSSTSVAGATVGQQPAFNS